MADKEIPGLVTAQGGALVAASGDVVHTYRTPNSRGVTLGALAGMDTHFGGGPSGNGEVRPATLAASQDNYSASTTANLWLLASTAPVNITGIANGVADRMLFLKNDGLNPITLKNNSASSLIGNRFDSNYDCILGAGDGALLIYTGATSPIGDAKWSIAATFHASDLVFDVEGQGPIVGGASVTSKNLGTQGAGTLTLNVSQRPMQHYINNAAHTLAPGTTPGACSVDITNGASAGAITSSGFTKVSGDAFTTTNGNKFRCYVSVGAAGSLLIVNALQ